MSARISLITASIAIAGALALSSCASRDQVGIMQDDMATLRAENQSLRAELQVLEVRVESVEQAAAAAEARAAAEAAIHAVSRSLLFSKALVVDTFRSVSGRLRLGLSRTSFQL